MLYQRSIWPNLQPHKLGQMLRQSNSEPAELSAGAPHNSVRSLASATNSATKMVSGRVVTALPSRISVSFSGMFFRGSGRPQGLANVQQLLVV